MEKPVFDGSETIGGFPLLKIKHALSFVGILDDRDDIATVADALACPRPQAERVLGALERRGFVARTGLNNKWDKTALGKQLTYQWQPPPRLEPAINRDDDDDDDHAINEMFDDVPCSLLRTDDDNADAFEDADLEVGLWIQYTSPRVIEITVAIPDDYENRDSSRTLESSVYLGVAEAKRFAAALQTAIERGEAEIARRAIADAKPRKKGTAPEQEPAASSPTPVRRAVTAETAPKPGAAARAAATAAKAERAAEKRRRVEQRALEATMKELAGKTRRRKEPTP
jgi:hypothetical protein